MNTNRGDHRSVVALAATLALAALGAPEASARPQLDRPFTGPIDINGGGDRSRFGAATAEFGGVLVVGAPGDSLRGVEAGSIHVYVQDQGTGAFERTQVIQPPGLLPFDRFGGAVAIFGNVLVVGAKGDDTAAPNAGAAYVFTRAGQGASFTFTEKLTPPTGGVGDGFGASVAVLLGRIAVGAPRADLARLDAGAAYVYDVGGGTVTLDAVITDPAASVGDGLGTSVAVFQDRLYVGAERYDEPGGRINTGAVLEFIRDNQGTWAPGQVLTGSLAESGSNFGATLAYEPPRPGVLGTLAVGAPDAPRPGEISSRGLVTVFQSSVGTPWTEVLAHGLDDDETGSLRGSALALQNGVLFVGAPGVDEARGAVEVFRRDPTAGWALERTVVVPGAQERDRLGSAVSLFAQVPVMGAPGFDGPAQAHDDVGRVWTTSALWAGLGEIDCAPNNLNSLGLYGSIAARGSDLLAEDDLTLEAGMLPPATFGLALVSRTRGFTANPGGSQGNLCLSGAIGRFNDRITQADGAGRLSIPVGLGSLPQPTGAVAAQAGETWWFQIWYRDNLGNGPTSNYTSTVGIRFL